MKIQNKLIGISGKIGSGKDFYADFIMKKISSTYGIVPDHRKFAEKVKEVTAVITNKPLETMYTQNGKNEFVPMFNATVGEMQQIIGTNIFRKYDNDFWVKVTLSDYEEGMSMIISDVRFKNEADFIINMGGILIRLEGDPLNIRANSSRDMTHQSETDLDDYDKFTIVHYNEVGPISPEFLWNRLINL